MNASGSPSTASSGSGTTTTLSEDFEAPERQSMLGREQEYREVLERATGPISSSAVWDEAQANFLLHCLMAIFFLAGSSLCFFFAFLMHFFSCTGLPVGAA